jgi:glutamate carboxypeptidase
MLSHHAEILKGIKERQNDSVSLLIEWANINSYSHNILGLSKMALALNEAFKSLDGEREQISLSPVQTINSKGENTSTSLGDCLVFRKHMQSPIQVFFGGHMDTVYPPSNPFQKVIKIDSETLKGPGVADMKGGLVILLKSLEAFEKSPYAGKLGWTVLINSDEEIGSPGSDRLFKQYAKYCDVGLIFEPSFPDGSFVNSRKGSANFTVVARGRSAHAGRDFYNGRNAIQALARFVTIVEQFTDKEKGITLNVGAIEGGGPVNIVPDLAICRLNLRTIHNDDFVNVKEKLNHRIHEANASEGIKLTLHQETMTPPKPFDDRIQRLFSAMAECSNRLGVAMQSQPSGGTCDGCRLYAYGVPNIDTMGAIGGHIHTPSEYIYLPSLYQRTQLTTLFLMMLANQEIHPFLKDSKREH